MLNQFLHMPTVLTIAGQDTTQVSLLLGSWSPDAISSLPSGPQGCWEIQECAYRCQACEVPGRAQGIWLLGRGWYIRLELHCYIEYRQRSQGRVAWVPELGPPKKGDGRERCSKGKSPGHLMGKWVTEVGCHTGFQCKDSSVSGQTCLWRCREWWALGHVANTCSGGWRLEKQLGSDYRRLSRLG